MISSRFTSHASRFMSFVPRVLPLLALLLCILLFFYKLAFSNLILARGDTFLYFYPYWQAAAEALGDGRVPLWNPYLFMGSPLLANSQVGFFYPLNWPIWLLLPTPYAVSASILIHLFIAGWGAYLAGRWALSLGRSAAFFTAVLFALSGYLTAQVEHVNQLQGLAWLPWFLVVAAYCQRPGGVSRTRQLGVAVLAFAFLFSMQLLAGHTQTAFITGIAMVIWCVGLWAAPRIGGDQVICRFRRDKKSEDSALSADQTSHLPSLKWCGLAALVLGGGMALLLTAAQLFPTLELVQLSSRQGGLPVNEVLSFSLHPLLLTRALLPHYGRSLFTEYVAFFPVIAMMLAFLGAWQWRRWPGVLPALLLMLGGLLLALGLFNPLYWLLARLPGFNLFRVPARWLVLYALGVSSMAGVGWQIIWDRWLGKGNEWRVKRPLQIALLIIIGLLTWGLLAMLLDRYFPAGPEAPYQRQTQTMVLAWLLGALFTYVWIIGYKGWRGHPYVLILLSLVGMFLASRALPYNNPTTPEAYFDLRPSAARLLAENRISWPIFDGLYSDGDSGMIAHGSHPPDRFLSLSDIFFDPGDQMEIDSVYEGQLPETALYDYTVAIKQKEIIGPNLSLVYGLPSVDGFDGGILPLNSYSQLMTLLLPRGVTTTDGRLREHLTAVPDSRWLDLFNGRYLISDKVGDTWQRGVFFDLQHPEMLVAGETIEVAYLPDFPATAVLLLGAGEVGEVLVKLADGSSSEIVPARVGEDLWRVDWPDEKGSVAATAVSLQGPPSGSWRVSGLTLVNEKDDTFQSVVPGNYRLIHSGDVKIYENLDAQPRAFLVHDWGWQPNVAASIAAMAEPGFDPGRMAVLIGDDEGRMRNDELGMGTAEIIIYEPERVVVQTDSETASLLLLTDAYYPGWETVVDGESAPLYQADGLFRGVFVPAGQHEVLFEFMSESYEYGRVVSLISLVVWMSLLILVLVYGRWRRP